MGEGDDNVKKTPTPTSAGSTDLALSRDADTTTAATASTTSTTNGGTEKTEGTNGSQTETETNLELGEDDDGLSGSEETGYNLYSGVDEEISSTDAPKRSEEEAFLDAMALLVGGDDAADAADDAADGPEGKPPAPEVKADVAEPVKEVAPIVETEETIQSREKLKLVYQDLDRFLSILPSKDNAPADPDVLRKKVAEGKFNELSVPELRMAMKWELEEPGFGQKSGFKVTEEASRLSNAWLNSVVTESHGVLAHMRMTRGPGDPIALSTVGTDPLKPKEGFAHRPETFDALFVNGELSFEKLKEMQKSGQIESSLIFEPKGIPTVSDLNKMSNSLEWLNNNRDRIKEATERINADGYWHVLTDVLQIKDKPKWAPPKEAQDLEAYSEKMKDNLNLMFRVRNYAEAIQSLNNIGGDFKSEALEKLKELGDVRWDPEKRKITKLNLNLPDSLEATPENERKLQKLRDWLKEYSGPVDQAMDEYEKANPIRFGDVPQKGTVGQDANGKLVYTKDAEGQVMTLVTADNKVYNRNLFGQLVDGEGKSISDEAVKKEMERGSKSEEFDYIVQKFSLRNGESTVDVTTTKDYFKDHMLNQQNMFGLARGNVTEPRSFKPWDHALVQTQMGRMEFVRADRLGEFQMIQGFFHYGAKVAAVALDAGMIVSGGIGVKAALSAGKGLAVAVNVGRIALGVGGFLDPAFRQMGETGQTIRDIRHKAILFDVTQGLARQGAGKLLGTGMLFQGKGAAEVAKIIEETAWMHRAEQVTRGVFMGADAVWLPLMSGGVSNKIERMRGHDPGRQMDRALISRGSGAGEYTGFGSGGTDKFDPAASAKKVFDAYSPLIGGGESVKNIFDRAQKVLASGDEKQVKALRDDELVGLFNPSATAMGKWRESSGKPIGHLAPNGLPVEKPADRREKVAHAMSMLFLAQKDGQLPADGVLAKRTVTVPGYTIYPAGAGEGPPPPPIEVPPVNVDQKVTVDQVVSILQNAALDNTDPTTQLAAADALWRSGVMSTGKYAGVCFDLVQNQPDKDLKMKALKQMSDLLLVKHVEETDPTGSNSSVLKSLGDGYGLEERNIIQKLETLAQTDADADIRGMSGAVVKAHGLRVADNAKGDAAKNAFDRYYGQWQEAKQPAGSFHDKFVAEQIEAVETPLPRFDNASLDAMAQHNAARQERMRGIMSLMTLEGEPGGEKFSKQINEALFSLASADLGSPRPDIKLTTSAFNILVERRAKLSEGDCVKLGEIALNVMDIRQQAVSTTDAATAKAQSQANHDSAMAILSVMGQLPKIFEGPAARDQRIIAEDSLKMNYLGPAAIGKGWGQHAMMRVAAIQGLTSLGKGEKDGNIVAIADRLRTDNGQFPERDPYVRSAALQALNKLDPTLFGLSAKELEARQLPNIRPDNLLKYERDPLSVETLYHAHDTMRAYQDPDALNTVADYSAEVEEMQRGKETTVTNEEVLAWIKANEAKFGMLDQNKLFDKAKQDARKELWSGFLGWLDYNTSFQKTVDNAEEAEAKRKMYGVRTRERDPQFAALTNFKEMQPHDQEMAMKTLLYIVTHGDQKLFAQDEQVEMRTKAARALSELANWQAQNNDRVQNKSLLTAVVVRAIQEAPKDLPGDAKMHLIDAVNSIVKRDLGQDFDSGKKADYYGLSPNKAGAVLSVFLQRQKDVYGDTSKKFGEKVSDEHKTLRAESERVQLELIDSLYNLRYMGAFPVLRARGPDSVLDPANPGSYIPQVRDRAKLAVESLYYGTSWLKQDAPKRLTGTPEGDASKITSQLVGEQPKHYQNLVSDIFASMKDQNITSPTDVRIAALQQAMKHPDQRVRLASGIALAESGLPVDNPAKVEAARVLRELSGRKLSGQAGIEDVRSSMRSVFESAGTKLTGARDTDAQQLNGLLAKKQPTAQDIDEQCKSIVASAKNLPVEASNDPRLAALQNALKSPSERVRLAASLALVDSKLPESDASRQEAAKLLKDSSVLGGFDVWRMEAGEALLKIKRAEYPGANIANIDSLLDTVGWMRNGSTKLGADKDDVFRADHMRRAIDAASADFNNEKAALSIFAACADKPIKSQDDPRRQVLLDALKHPEERIKLAAAWMLSESGLPLDREDGVKTLASIATNPKSDLAGGEARTLLTGMIKAGNQDDQLLAHVSWREAYKAGHKDGVPEPAGIPTSNFERTVAYFKQAPRAELQQLIANGSRSEKEAVIAALTGWSEHEVRNQINLASEAEKKAQEAEREKLMPRNPYLGMRSCIDGRPPKEDFKLSLTGYDTLNGFRRSGGKSLDETFGATYGQMPEHEINARLNGLLGQLQHGEVPGRQISASGKFAGLEDFDFRNTDWQTFRALSRDPKRFRESPTELPNLQSQLKRVTAGVAEQPSWRPAELGERPRLGAERSKDVLGEDKVNDLYYGVSWIRKSASMNLGDTTKAHAEALAKMIDTRQPHNSRYTAEAIFASVAQKPIVSADDPRREQLLKALKHDNERVRLASAWVLADSKVSGDFKTSADALATLCMKGSRTQLRDDSLGLLRDMVMLGSDTQKDTALGAWRSAWDAAGRVESLKPPSFTERDQARKYAFNGGMDDIRRKSFDQRKALFMHLWNESNPDKKIGDAELENWLQPSQFSPVLDASIRLYDNRLSPKFMRRPFEEKFSVAVDPLGFNAPKVQAAGFYFGNDGSDWNREERPSLTSWTRGARSSDGNGSRQYLDQVTKHLQGQLDDSSMKGAKISRDARDRFSIQLDASQLGGKAGAPLTISGAEKEDAIKFMSEASPDLMKQFSQDLFKYRPELAQQQEIPADELAIMFKNWIDQKSFGREHVIISEKYHDSAVEQLSYLPVSPGADSRFSSKDFSARWSDVSKKRDAYRQETLNYYIEQQLTYSPPTVDDKPHWAPAGKPEVVPPKYVSSPPIEMLERYKTDVTTLLPSDVRGRVTESGGISVRALQALAKEGGDIASGFGTDLDLVLSPNDQAVLNTIRAQRLQRNFKWYNDTRSK